MSAPQVDTGVKETDKPFYLAVFGTIGLIGAGISGVYTGHWPETKDFLAVLSPLVLMAWTFYFHSKLD